MALPMDPVCRRSPERANRRESVTLLPRLPCPPNNLPRAFDPDAVLAWRALPATPANVSAALPSPGIHRGYLREPRLDSQKATAASPRMDNGHSATTVPATAPNSCCETKAPESQHLASLRAPSACFGRLPRSRDDCVRVPIRALHTPL